MKFLRRLFGGLSSYNFDTLLIKCDKLHDLLEERYVRRDYHDERVRGLLAANNRRLEETRALTREVDALERELMRAVRKAHENAAFAKAVEWVSRTDSSGTVCRIRAFVSGYTGEVAYPSPPYDAGRRIRRETDQIVAGATKAAGL
jgi:hypothetical protein